MATIFESINTHRSINALSKHEHIVLGIIDAIDAGILAVGDQLPSINTMATEIGYARKTFVKAYTELKDRGLVISKSQKGYFIASTHTHRVLRIALVVSSFNDATGIIYTSLKQSLGIRYHIDVFFHHHDAATLRTLIETHRAGYGLLIVSPIIDTHIASELLQSIPPTKLVVIQHLIELPKTYTTMTVQIEIAIYQKLVELTHRLLQYQNIVLLCPNRIAIAAPVTTAFRRYLKEYDLSGQVVKNSTLDTLQKNTAYFCMDDALLWKLVKQAQKNEFRMGKDIGILSYGDSPPKALIGDGITTIAPHYEAMVQKIARFIKDKVAATVYIPVRLRERGSL